MLKKLKSILKLGLYRLKANGWLPNQLFFIVFPDFMNLEIEKTVAGLLKYKENDLNINEYKLRRNIHRIEKGLCSINRRDVFALSFIEETVSTLVKMRATSELSSNFSYYAKILNEYFKVVNHSNGIISRAFTVYSKNIDLSLIDKSSPKLLFLNKIEEVDADRFIDFLKVRRSVRFYQNMRIERHKILNALHAASESPSACNRYPSKYYVFTDQKKIKSLLPFAHGFQGDIENVPGLVILVGDLSAYETEGDRHLIYIDGSLGLMNFILSLHSQGLGSCILNFSENYKLANEIKKILNLSNHEKVITMLSFGYPDYSVPVPFSVKKYDVYKINPQLVTSQQEKNSTETINSCSID